MHPILSERRRLAIYLAGWLPLAALLAYLFSVPGHLGWLEAFVLSLPLTILYAFDCLAAGYSCRATPLERSSFTRISSTHLAAALVASIIWVGIEARLLAWALGHIARFQGIERSFSPFYPLLFGLGIVIYLFVIAVNYVLLAMEASREAEAREIRAGALARDAELKALKAQVNPHFLFNSLHSINALTLSDPARAREMCLLLAEFLRRTLGLGDKILIPLEEELSLVRSFLGVEQVRFGARLRFEENISSDVHSLLLPPLLLQPLIENAVGHGIANLTEGGAILIEAARKNGALRIVIENTFDPEAPPRRKNGMGLRNVQHRLEARYPGRASLQVESRPDSFRVTLLLPAEERADHDGR
jgi:two-component system, LytTR family, sensor histidine kinase AlgZ